MREHERGTVLPYRTWYVLYVAPRENDALAPTYQMLLGLGYDEVAEAGPAKYMH